MAYTIYASTVNEYITIREDWSILRNGGSEVVNIVETNPTRVSHQILQDGNKFFFYRTYMLFDLSTVVDPITSMNLYLHGNLATGDTSYVVYGGEKFTGNAGEYPSYLNELTAGELSTIIIQSGQYTSCQLDIVNYPPSDPPRDYIIGLVANDDYLNNIGSTFSTVRISNGVGTVPYLIINGGSYPYEVSGIPGANITEVSGVPVANITNIMGV